MNLTMGPMRLAGTGLHSIVIDKRVQATEGRSAETGGVLADNVALFTRFHAQNSKNRFLEPKQIYDINHDNMFLWLTSINKSRSPSEIVDFVTAFASHLRHVSFSEFQDALHRTTIEIVTRIRNERPDAVVLVIDGEISKSNTWITLLVWQFLADVVTHLTDDLDDVPAAVTRDPSKRVFVLQPDDMSYSGTQMSFVLEQIQSWKAKVTFLPVVGFMGSAAAERLSSLSAAFSLPSTVDIVPSLRKVLEVKYGGVRASEIFNMLNRDPWKTYYGVWEGATLIYFDHKLADRVSIPTKLLVDAVSYNISTDTIETFRLISNCEDAIYKSESGAIIDPRTQFVDLDDNYTCPKAYYKTLDYRFDGRLLDDRNSSVIENLRRVSNQ